MVGTGMVNVNNRISDVAPWHDKGTVAYVHISGSTDPFL